MAHYALLNSDNVVVNVIVGNDEGSEQDWEQLYSDETGYTAKRTSYNTVGNTHLKNKEPFRKNYAGIGGTYDPVNDAFIPLKPYPSWVLNTDTFLWEAPVAHEDRGEGIWYWLEEAPGGDDPRVQGWNFDSKESILAREESSE